MNQGYQIAQQREQCFAHEATDLRTRWARRLWAVLAGTLMGLVVTQFCVAAAGHYAGAIYGPGGSIAVGKFWVPQTQDCLNTKPGPNASAFELEDWEDCRQLIFYYRGFVINSPENQSEIHDAPRTIEQTSTTASPLSLNSSTPELPFLGNPLAVISAVPNSIDFNSVTATYDVFLRREADCSLTEDLVWLNASQTTPSASLITSLPSAQDYFHKLAGLNTTGDTFSQGCAVPTLGQPTTDNILLLGTTTSGAVISATVANNGVNVSVTDTTANTFTTTLAISTPALGGITAADLNGDGFADLVMTFVPDPATNQASTGVYLGNGDGTFRPGVYYDVAGDVTVDDVNGDGKPDIVVCGATTPGVTTLIGAGNGTFTAGAASATGISACTEGGGQVISADFNNDGKKDLLIHGQVVMGHGDGTFTAGTTLPGAGNFNYALIGVEGAADLNKDGKVDVVIAQAGYVAVFYGNGDGTFAAGPRYAGLPTNVQVTITDVDGDGNPDIVLGTASGGVYGKGCCDEVVEPHLFQVLMNRGDGTFVDSVGYPYGTYGNGYRSVAGPQIAIADFNGDNKPDVLVMGSGLSLLPGDGTGKLGAPVASALSGNLTMLVAADINKDGKPDVVVGTQSGVSVLINQGNGTFAGELDYALPNPVVSLVTGDFNGDGFIDIAAGDFPGLGQTGDSGVYVLYGQSNGTFAAPVKIDNSRYPTGLAAGDLNGDGRVDLIIADQGNAGTPQVNGVVHVYLANADGSFTAAATPTTGAANYSVAALGDLNGDGKLDLILGGSSGDSADPSVTDSSVYTLLGKGDGTFQPAVATALSGTYGIGSTSIALADMNHDGHLDVVVGDANAYTNVLLGHGDGTLTLGSLALGQQPATLAAADLNGDGFPELLVGNQGFGGSNLTVFMNANAWTATAALPATTTTLSSSATTLATGQSLTLTATVTPGAGSTVPTGTVTFLDGGTSLGTVTVGATGSATFTTSTLAAGSHSLSASYGGSSSFAASSSAATTVTVKAATSDFTLALSPASGSVTHGQSAQTTVSLSPTNGFNQTVSLTCLGLPAGASCSFAPASVAVSGSAATSTLTITTASMSASNKISIGSDPLSSGGLLLAGIALPVVVRKRRTAARWARGAALMALIVAAGALPGCGGDGNSGAGASASAPTGKYTVTVTATAGSTSHTATYALTIT